MTCRAARGLLAYSAVFCAQHRLSHKLMMEAAATRKHLQVDQCAYHFVDDFSERRVASRDTYLQRVVAQAFPSAQQDLVDVAFASPPSPSQLRLLQVPTHTSTATAHCQNDSNNHYTNLCIHPRNNLPIATPPCCLPRPSRSHLQTAIRLKKTRV